MPGGLLAGLGEPKRKQEALSEKAEVKPFIRGGGPYVGLNIHHPPRMKGFKLDLALSAQSKAIA